MIGQIKFAKRANDRESSFVFQLVTPSADTLFALRLIVGIQRQAKLGQVLGRVPKIEDALGQGEVLAEELFQPIAAIRKRDLLLGVVPTDLSRLATQLRAKLIKLVKP